MNNQIKPLLHKEHSDLGAKLASFGGWEMPLSYPHGTLFEHQSCRETAAVFDVSHLGRLMVSGNDAALDYLLTNTISTLEKGDLVYSHILDEDGSTTEDLICQKHDDSSWLLLVNAGNREKIKAELTEAGLWVSEITMESAFVAAQGPKAREMLRGFLGSAASVGRFKTESFSLKGETCHIFGTGYTGEDGVECLVPAVVAPLFWREVLKAGLVPAGLAARDILRLEAGLPLFGNDLGPGITPLQVRMGWVVDWKKDFRGKKALEREKKEGCKRLLWGLKSDSRRPLRTGAQVKKGENIVGKITSGNYSPILKSGIGLALLEGDVEEGDVLVVENQDTTKENAKSNTVKEQTLAVVRPVFV